jgi:hypothetical protein
MTNHFHEESIWSFEVLHVVYHVVFYVEFVSSSHHSSNSSIQLGSLWKILQKLIIKKVIRCDKRYILCMLSAPSEAIWFPA